MRLAGTWKQYSKNAMPQLARITFQSASLRYLRWPYQAKVMKTLEMVSRTMVRIGLLINKGQSIRETNPSEGWLQPSSESFDLVAFRKIVPRAEQTNVQGGERAPAFRIGKVMVIVQIFRGTTQDALALVALPNLKLHSGGNDPRLFKLSVGDELKVRLRFVKL